MASIISLRSRPALSFSFNDYAHAPAPCAYSSSANCCCCCCANSMYRVPISSGYCYNLYGLRQSSLIQWSPCRKLVSGGLNSFFSARLPACDVDFSSYCDEVLRFRQMRVGGKKGGLRKCLVFEESYEIGDDDGDDEAEILLSLLTEDVSEVCRPATKKTRRLLRKPVVEETGGNGEVSKKCGSKKKRVDLGVLESENRYGHGSVVSSGQKDNWRRAEVIRREEEKEALLRQENRKARLREESGDSLLINRSTRKEENVGLLRKMSENEMDERKSSVREENRKVTSRSEEDVLRREENKQKLRKDGSSCSSYYSLSSMGDYESDNDIELREGRYMGESLINHTRKSKNNAVVNQVARRKEEHQHEGYKEDHGVILEKKSTQNEYMGGSSVVESDFRKKSEKKLVDVSVQEMELREETSQKQSKHSMGCESNYKKSSDYQVSYDDRQEKSTARTKFEEERKQQQSQTSNEVIRQTGTRMKHRRFTGMQESHSDDVINTYGSQKTYGGKDEMTAKVESQEKIEESQKAVGHSTREDEYRRTSVQLANISEGQDIDIRKTSTYQQRIETSVSDQDYSTSIHGSINAAKQKQYNQVSELVGSRGTSQQLTKKEGKSIHKKGSDKHLKQENVHLGYGSTSESRIIKRDNELGKVSPMQTGDSGKFDVEGQGRNKPNSAIQVGIQINLESGALAQKSNVGIATNEGSDGNLQVVSTSLNEQNQVISPELHSEIYGEGSSSGTHEHPSKFVYPEGRTIESAAQLEKSSTHYVGEFINQVREEISSSEIQKEKRAKFIHEEHYQHNLDQYNSGDSNSKKERETASDTKGPSDEIWKVAEPSAGESSKKEEQDDAIKAGKGHEKRTGRSLWNVISDIVLLRWSPRSESHGSGRKTGGRSSPNQSTSGETWFSGHEAVENEEVTQEKEQKSITLGLSDSNRGEKIHSQVEEGSSSSTFDGDIKRVGINIPSSSDALELQPISSSVHSGVISERIPTAETESTPLPAFRLQRSPAVQGVSEAEEAKASSSDMKEKLNTVLTMTTESVIDERELRHNKFQRQDQVIKDRFDEWEDAYRLEAEQRKNDEKFMWEALLEAQNAADNWEVPVGAVLVHNGKIIARGFNRVEELRDSTAHAEMICIREASNILRSWRLSLPDVVALSLVDNIGSAQMETTLYVTLEPCPMCAGAILQARVDTVVWGAPNKLLGADGSWIRLFPDGDRGNGLELSDKPPAPVHPFHPKIIIRRGVLASECADAMQQFFKLRRKKDKESDSSSAPPTGSRVSHRPFKLLAKMHDAFSLMFCL